MEELLKITREGFAGLDARLDSLHTEVGSLHAGVDSLHAEVGSLHAGCDSLHSRFDALGEGLLFVARKVLAEPEIRELRKILDGNITVAKRSA